MKHYRRTLKSREEWRGKAVKRADKLRDQSKLVRRLRAKVDALEKALLGAIAAAKEANARLLMPSDPCPPSSLGDRGRIRIFAVLLFLVAFVSFSAIPKVMQIIGALQIGDVCWIPSCASPINWVYRFGLWRLSLTTRINERWLLLIDASIDLGAKKLLVALRVRLSALSARGGAITREDCEVIGLAVAAKWNGELVAEALKKIMKKVGIPDFVLKDGGGDLGKAMKLLKASDEYRKILCLADIGHVVANALKAKYKESEGLMAFLKAIKRGATKLRQSDLAFLAPPKIRTKGRFQSISRVGAWGIKVLEFIQGSGAYAKGSMGDRVRKMLPQFGKLRTFLEGFASMCVLTDQFMKLFKTKGFNQASYREGKQMLAALDDRCPVKTRLLKWLEDTLNKHCRAAIKQVALLVSTDALEGLFGTIKAIIARAPKGEFNANVLLVPALCGKLSVEDIEAALAGTSHIDLSKWIVENIPTTLAKERRKILGLRKKNPKPGQALSPSG